MSTLTHHASIFFGAMLGTLVTGVWLPWLTWYFGLDPVVRRNLPPRNRPWWVP